MSAFKKLGVIATAAVFTLGVGVAHAQEVNEAENVDSPPDESVQVAQAGAGTDAGGLAGPAGSDHRRFVGKFAVGYLGFRQMSLGTLGTFVQAPVIGGRYWLSRGLGIDVGLGFSTGGGSAETDTGMMTTDVDVPAPLTFILHGGLPLALAESQHFVFEIVPEMNLGFSSMTQESAVMGGDDTDFSGTHVDIGARAGGEVHFGFIDVPQLSLQAGVSLRLNLDWASEETGPVTTSQSASSFSTGVGDNPWNIFIANIAALYYFDG